MLNIEVIYATLVSQELIKLKMEAGATIQKCIEKSNVLQSHPEINLDEMKVGIFSQVKPLNHEVSDGDRIEIYRPLMADPKAIRRKKAEQAKG